MANRIFDNVIIIDSAMGNLNAVGGTSANIANFNVQAIAFWAATTLGNCVLTGANTGLDHITHFGFVTTESSMFTSLLAQEFPLGLRLSALKVPTITAGTAWVYLA